MLLLLLLLLFRLAEINGTLRDGMFRFDDKPRNWTAPDVFCKYCGEISHPSSDCPQRNMPADKQKLLMEYELLMREIEVGPSVGAVDAEKSYEALMAAIGSGEDRNSGGGGGGGTPWQQDNHSHSQQGGGGGHYGVGIPPPQGLYGQSQQQQQQQSWY